jgi:hypothetical protein
VGYPKIPKSYEALRRALESGAYPAERHYLDFKEALYSDARSGKGLGKSKEKVHDELARDMASFGVRGGYLIFGVHEDKEKHEFTAVEMELPSHIDQTVEQIAQARIRPPLSVVPHVIGRPEAGSRGFLVIEIPESPTAPHQVRGTYYGRGETGNVPLSDDEVEALMMRRGRVDARLQDAMAVTNEIVESLVRRGERACHLMITAIPSQPWPGMFLQFTEDPPSRQALISEATGLLNAVSDDRDFTAVAFEGLMYHARTGLGRGASFSNWDLAGGNTVGGERWLGIGDDGELRFVNLDIGTLDDGTMRSLGGVPELAQRNRPVFYADKASRQTLDILQLTSRLAEKAGYGGDWLVGIEVIRLAGRIALLGGRQARGYDAPDYAQTVRVAGSVFAEHANKYADDLLGGLLRDLGVPSALSAVWLGSGRPQAYSPEIADDRVRPRPGPS